MGIDVSAYSTSLPKGRFFQLSSTNTLRKIEESARAWAASQGLGPLCTLDRPDPQSLDVYLTPIGDPVEFAIRENRITVAFRSSNLGPGFHAAVVEMLDRIARDVQFTWAWTASDGEDLDETGFARSRDYDALQLAMLRFLGSLGRFAQAHYNRTESAPSFCLPLGLAGEVGNIACPLGFRPLRWGRDLGDLDDGGLRAEAEDFFVWWEPGLTGATWLRFLRAQLWQNALWRPAVTAEDVRVNAQIAHTLARIRTLGAVLPADLAAALEEHDRLKIHSRPPAPTGIGYRKRLLYHQVTAAWRIGLPGYLTLVESADERMWQHPDLLLELSALLVQRKMSAEVPFEWPSSLEGPVRQTSRGLQYKLSARAWSDDGGSHQTAALLSEQTDETRLLILTLSSAEDWPYAEFGAWVDSVVCAESGSVPSIKHAHLH